MLSVNGALQQGPIYKISSNANLQSSFLRLATNAEKSCSSDHEDLDHTGQTRFTKGFCCIYHIGLYIYSISRKL